MKRDPLNGVNFPEKPYMINVKPQLRTARRFGTCRNSAESETMGRIFKLVVILLVLGAIGIIGYAYLGDMKPDAQQQRIEVTLPGGLGGSGASGGD